MILKRRRFACFAPIAALTLATSLIAVPNAYAASGDVETIVMVRHGEKPLRGLGQLSCTGLNRALALPRVIEAKFGKPDAIIAPDPARQKRDVGVQYDYVRPLATIEPAAVYFGMPVNASLGFDQVEELRAVLLSPDYRRSVVVVAWEHRIIEALARKIVTAQGGASDAVPRWQSSDFDSIYVLRITRSGDQMHVAFSVDHEGLDGQSAHCPGA